MALTQVPVGGGPLSELSGLMTNEHHFLSGPLVNKEGSVISPFIFAFKWEFSEGSQGDLKTRQNKVFMIEYPGGDFLKWEFEL